VNPSIPHPHSLNNAHIMIKDGEDHDKAYAVHSLGMPFHLFVETIQELK
jgi:hypothetical protein